MRIRTGATAGRPAENHVSGSMLDQPRQTLRLPPGLVPAVRREARRILDQNSHLGPQQLDTLIRYVQVKAIHNVVLAAVTDQPVLATGEPHPALGKLTSLQAPIAAMERALSLTIPSRRENLSREEQLGSALRDKAQPKPEPGKLALRLA